MLRDGVSIDGAGTGSLIRGNDAELPRYAEFRGVDAADDGALGLYELLRGLENTDEKRRPLARIELVRVALPCRRNSAAKLATRS